MATTGRSRATKGRGSPGPPYWLLGRRVEGSGRGRGLCHDVLTVDVAGGRALPLFGCEEGAVSFLGPGSSPDGERWRAVEAWAGELLTLLSASEYTTGPCAGVTGVVFDPPTLELVEAGAEEIVRMGRRTFMDELLGRGGRWTAEYV